MIINVSNHAIDQHIKRFGGSKKHIDRKKNSIRKVVAFGLEITPKNKMMKLLNNQCRKARYYVYGGVVAVVAVVEDDTVVTVYKYEQQKFDPICYNVQHTGR